MGSPELPPNPERLIDLLELVALFRRPKRSCRDCGHRCYRQSPPTNPRLDLPASPLPWPAAGHGPVSFRRESETGPDVAVNHGGGLAGGLADLGWRGLLRRRPRRLGRLLGGELGELRSAPDVPMMFVCSLMPGETGSSRGSPACSGIERHDSTGTGP
jgi:hypothetical protein